MRQYKDLMLQKESAETDKASTESQSILDQLKEYAECDICFDSMADSKIFACSSDHWIFVYVVPCKGAEHAYPISVLQRPLDV